MSPEWLVKTVIWSDAAVGPSNIRDESHRIVSSSVLSRRRSRHTKDVRCLANERLSLQKKCDRNGRPALSSSIEQQNVGAPLKGTQFSNHKWTFGYFTMCLQ
ncbi:hypothetical protein V5799_030648 [Amblyomma americanum]|uniref:Uncharacterized protein n=1 Tax=Amblyomma americanum TaxID=6943 RepID=A0AAQ4EMQ3_AMBAM